MASDPSTDTEQTGDQLKRAATTHIERIVERYLAEFDRPDLAAPGTRTVGANGEFESIIQAWDYCDHGDEIVVTGGYDGQAAAESFPIQLDYSETEATLRGGHPSKSVIDAGDADANVLEVYGVGSSDYRNLPLVKDIRLQGGQDGLVIHGAPHSSYRNVIADRVGGHGFRVAEYEVDGSNKGSFGMLFDNCHSWGAGRDGFNEEFYGHPHGTKFRGCISTANHEAGFEVRGSNTYIDGCTSQLNWDFGIEGYPRSNTTIKQSYIEGNCRGEKWDAANDGPPTEIYIKGAKGVTIEDCYLHGVNPRGVRHSHNRVQRAIRFDDCDKGRIVACTFRRYGEGAVHLGGSRDTEVARPSHILDEVGPGDDPVFFVRGAVRTRDNGEIMAADLTQVEGQHEGDKGVHKTGDGRRKRCVWHDGQWWDGAGNPLGN